MNALVSFALDKIRSEPLVIVGLLAAGIVWLAGHFGIVLDKPSITSVLTPVVVSLVGRLGVVPVSKHKVVVAQAKAELPPPPGV